MSAVAQLLKSSDIFAGLGEKTLETLATGMREVKFNAGKQIFSRHDPAACLYVIVEGRARLSIVSAEGRELSFRLLGRGETLGEIALLDGGRRSADATALTDVVAMSLARSVLDSLISTDPDVSRGIICFVCSRLRSTSEQLEAIALYSLESRIARFLLSAVRLRGLNLEQPEVMLTLEMTQGELGMLVGATRPRVSDAFAALESTEVIRRDGSRIFCRMPDLIAAAGGDELA